VAEPPAEAPTPPGYARGLPMPWRAKLWLKLALGATRVPPALLRRVGVRRHSFDAKSRGVLVDAVAGTIGLAVQESGRRPARMLEIGPGRLVVRAPMWAAFGVEETWFADIEDDAPADPAAYRRVAALATAPGLVPPALDGAATRAEVLARCRARLLIGGADALRAIPDGSIDLTLSSAVLEHVRREDLAPLLAELHRVSAPDAVALHGIDFHDHLGGGLNHLAFPSRFWEGRAIAAAGLYTNRLGLSEMLARFAAAGFAPRVLHSLVWEAPPWPARGVHPDVARSVADGRVAAATIVARPA